MGQKVHPIGFRLGYLKDWNSRWFAPSREFPKLVYQDYQIRTHLKKRLRHASVSKIEIRRAAGAVSVTIHTARPGLVIGKKGEEIDRLRQELKEIVGSPVQVNVEEIRRPELDAQLVAESVARQLEQRVMFRRAMKRAIQNAMRLGAQGIKVEVSGRLGGAEIARKEWYREGRLPLHTLRADIDYGFAEAKTKYGVIGVKVWIFKGEVFLKEEQAQGETSAAQT